LPYLRFYAVKIHEGPKPKIFKLQGQNPKKYFTGGKTKNDLYYRGKTLLTQRKIFTNLKSMH